MRKVLYGALAAAVLIPSVALAADLRGSESGSVSIGSDERVKNGYLAGNTVTSSGTILEDLIAAGNTVTVSGTVNNDIFAVGSTLTLNSPVGNSARVAGGTVTINNTIGSDLVAAGGEININSDARISDDLFAAGGRITINGDVSGRAYLTGGTITINSHIGGNVTIKGGEQIIIGDKAVIDGNLTYEANNEASIANGAQIKGTTNYTPTPSQHAVSQKAKQAVSAFAVIQMLATFLLLLLLVLTLPKTMRQLIDSTTEKPLENIGLGFVYAIATPVAALILLVTVFGMNVAFLAGTIFFLTASLAKFFVPLIMGNYLVKWLRKDHASKLDWITILVGVIGTTIIGLVPFIGWFVIFLLFLMAISQAPRTFQHLLQSQR